jgi:hypothetical protein
MATFNKLFLACLVCLTCSGFVNAASITYSISTDAVTETRNGVAAVGGEHMFLATDTLQTIFTYSDSAVGIESGNHVGTLYFNITDFTVSTNGFGHADSLGSTLVSNDRWPFGVVEPVDALAMNAHLPPSLPTGYPQYADGDGTVFTLRDMRLFWGEKFSGFDFLSDESLPSLLPVPGSGNGGVALVFATYESDGTTVKDEHVVLGVMNSVSVIPVPATVWLFMSALGMLAAVRRQS